MIQQIRDLNVPKVDFERKRKKKNLAKSLSDLSFFLKPNYFHQKNCGAKIMILPDKVILK
jgi:hypothetical protein